MVICNFCQFSEHFATLACWSVDPLDDNDVNGLIFWKNLRPASSYLQCLCSVQMSQFAHLYSIGTAVDAVDLRSVVTMFLQYIGHIYCIWNRGRPLLSVVGKKGILSWLHVTSFTHIVIFLFAHLLAPIMRRKRLISYSMLLSLIKHFIEIHADHAKDRNVALPTWHRKVILATLIDVCQRWHCHRWRLRKLKFVVVDI